MLKKPKKSFIMNGNGMFK